MRPILIALLASSTLWMTASVCAGITADAVITQTHGRAAWRGRELNEEEYQAVLKYQQGTTLLNQGKWQAAADMLSQAVKVMPNDYEPHCNLAIAFINLGRIKEASAELDKAFALAPDKPEPLLARAAVSQCTGHLEDALADYKQFVGKYPTHRLAPQAKGYITELTAELRAQKIASKSGAPSIDDYFDYATVQAVVKWNSDKFPLKVFIPADEEALKVPGYRKEFGEGLRNSFHEWQAKTNDKIAFDFVDKPSASDIECEWTEDVTRVKTPAEGGDSLVLYDGDHGITHVRITLLTRLAGQLSEASLPNTIKLASLHEIGHALGLIGHSPSPEDIMFCSLPAADEPRGLSERDVKTILHLYDPSVKVGVHLHEDVQATDKLSLNNEGTALASEQKFAAAAQKFQAALKIDPNFDVAKANLAACLNNMAVAAGKQGNYQAAVDNFTRALALLKGSFDKKTQVSILQNLALAYEKLGRSADAEATRTRARHLMATPAGGNHH